MKVVSVEELEKFILHRMLVVNNPADRKEADAKLCAMVARDQLGIVLDEIYSGRLYPPQPEVDGLLVELLKECADELEESIQNEGRLASFQILIDKIRTALNTRAHRPGWMPIETAPKDETRVRLLCPDGEDTGYFCAYPWNDSIPGEWSTDKGYGEPSHWQPLPKPPKPGEKEVGRG
jgi:hypothetical protein